MTIKELKEELQETLDFLEESFDDEEQVRVVNNTYFLRGATHILETKQGFVDLDRPIRE